MIAEEPRRVAFATLGCKLNQFETDSLATQFRDAGYEIVEFNDAADVYVINSCTVTNRADRKSRNLLYRARRAAPASDTAHARPGAPAPVVVVTGCYVDGHRESLENDEATYFVANEAKQSIPGLVHAHFNGEVIHPAGTVFDFPVPDRIFHTRSIVKVQDGCDNYCTFCIIPFVRGRATSRRWADVVAAAGEAIAEGAREIVLTGVNMSRYRDGAVDFAELVARCLELDAPHHDYRVRISSLEPDQLTDRFIELFDHPRMSPHLHLCLQSASERVLLAMRRQYTYDLYRGLTDRLRARDPLFNITTDVIVGFPGETEEDLESTIGSIETIGFGHVHTFPYSLRKGTRAERMPDHLPAVEKTRRAARIRAAAETAKRRYREQLVGHDEVVLVEKTERLGARLLLKGLGEHYVPVTVELPLESDPNRLENTFVRVRIVELGPGDDPVLVGRPYDALPH